MWIGTWMISSVRGATAPTKVFAPCVRNLHGNAEWGAMPMTRQVLRKDVPVGDTWDLTRLFLKRWGVGGSLRRVGKTGRRLRPLPRHARQFPGSPARMPDVRHRLRPARRPRRHLRDAEGDGGRRGVRVSGDEGPATSGSPGGPRRRRVSSGRRFWPCPMTRSAPSGSRRCWRTMPSPWIDCCATSRTL